MARELRLAAEVKELTKRWRLAAAEKSLAHEEWKTEFEEENLRLEVEVKKLAWFQSGEQLIKDWSR